MKTALAAALFALAAAAAADSSYDACMKLGGGPACVKTDPPIIYAPPPDPYNEMMEQLERAHDRQLWRQHLYEQSDRRAAELHHGNYLRYCATHSKRCRDELYGN